MAALGGKVAALSPNATMNATFRLLSALMIFPACTPAAALSGGVVQSGGATRSEVRRAVELHRASQRDELQREEEAAGRRLTPAELAQLRSQVRQQWSPRYDAPQAGVSARPAAALPAPAARSLTAPRSQRP